MVSMARPLIGWCWESQWEASQFSLVNCPYFLPTFPILLNPAELMDADGGLNVHHIVLVPTFDDVVVFITVITEAPPRVFAHPVEGKDFESVGMPLVRRQDHSPFTGYHVLCHVKAEAAKIAKGANLFPLVGCFDSMSAVFDNHESVPLCYRDQRVHVASAAGEVDRQDGFGTVRDFGRHLLRID